MTVIIENFPFELVGIVAVGLMTALFVLMTPLANYLNIITVPLGVEVSSCPYCPDFTIRRITWTDCDCCGDRIRENFAHKKSAAGSSDWLHFCDYECKEDWSE